MPPSASDTRCKVQSSLRALSRSSGCSSGIQVSLFRLFGLRGCGLRRFRDVGVIRNASRLSGIENRVADGWAVKLLLLFLLWLPNPKDVQGNTEQTALRFGPLISRGDLAPCQVAKMSRGESNYRRQYGMLCNQFLHIFSGCLALPHGVALCFGLAKQPVNRIAESAVAMRRRSVFISFVRSSHPFPCAFAQEGNRCGNPDEKGRFDFYIGAPFLEVLHVLDQSGLFQVLFPKQAAFDLGHVLKELFFFGGCHWVYLFNGNTPPR